MLGIIFPYVDKYNKDEDLIYTGNVIPIDQIIKSYLKIEIYVVENTLIYILLVQITFIH